MRSLLISPPRAAASVLFAAMVLAGPSHSDGQTRDIVADGAPISARPADPSIAGALRQVSPARMRHTVESLVAFGNRNTISSMDQDLPPGQGVTAAATWLQQQYEQISRECDHCLEVKTDTFTEPPQTGPAPRIVKPTTITNVYAILRGTDPSQATRMYLVTGHYDSRATDVMNTRGAAPGANDDASGVAVSLECARVLSRIRFPATIVFATVAGEEQGLNGSTHLAELAKREGWELAGVLNNDIVGGDTTPGDTLQMKSLVRVFSEGVASTATPAEVKRLLSLGLDSDSPSRELARAIVDVDTTYFGPGHRQDGPHAHQSVDARDSFRPVMEMRLDRYLRGGDHFSFNQEGFAAVRFTEWRENFDHQHQDVRVENGKQFGDLIQYDDFHYMANVARLNAATLATLASAPGSPRDVHVDTQDLDNNSDLLWQAPAGTSPAVHHSAVHYEVLWRETGAPMWQYAASVPGVQTGGEQVHAKMPISKDNVIFGVRACDAAGHCSPAVAPTPLPRTR